MKNMKNETNNKANNLRLGAVYINANTGSPCRLVHIVPCEGVWLEAYDGQGYGDTVKFEDCHYADVDEVEDYLADYRVYTGKDNAPSHKSLIEDSDGSMVAGWYNDDEGNAIIDRD